MNSYDSILFAILVLCLSPTSARKAKNAKECRKNEVFKSSSCDETCTGVARKCLREQKGCFCKPGWVINPKSNICILRELCSNQTATKSTTEETTIQEETDNSVLQKNDLWQRL